MTVPLALLRLKHVGGDSFLGITRGDAGDACRVLRVVKPRTLKNRKLMVRLGATRLAREERIERARWAAEARGVA